MKSIVWFIIIYLLVSCYFFLRWFLFSIRHPNNNVLDKFLSFLIMIIASSLWIFVIPIHGLNFMRKARILYRKSVQNSGEYQSLDTDNISEADSSLRVQHF